MKTSKIVMVTPGTFCANPETLSSNHFQKNIALSNVLESAQNEHENLQSILESNGIEIFKFKEDVSANTPDALFPNNWFCQLPDGRTFIFPMQAQNRRREVRSDIIDKIKKDKVYDLTTYADRNMFLEGTGSLIFDHEYKLAYACYSPRTSPELLQKFGELSGYKIIGFKAADQNGKEIYHTNVMMAMGLKTVVINMSAVDDKELLYETFTQTNKLIVDISHEQMNNFAGNMLLLQGKEKLHWVCSSRAYHSLNAVQRKALEQDGEILHAPLNTIEDIGGGSARCLMAEVFV